MATPATQVEVEAVFQNGSFHPVGADSGQWSEGQHVRLVIQKPPASEENAPIYPRIPGLHAGMVFISDDFNDPLPDEFWLGEE